LTSKPFLQSPNITSENLDLSLTVSAVKITTSPAGGNATQVNTRSRSSIGRRKIMRNLDRKDKQIEKKNVEFKELAVTESLSVVEMSHVHGGNGAPAPAGFPGGGGWGAPDALARRKFGIVL
jgi:hypothetical protein